MPARTRGRRPAPTVTAASRLPALDYQNDPIRLSVQRLGRKWTLLLIRDLAFLHLGRFSEFKRNNPGLTARVLSRRLRELQTEGLVERRGSRGEITYALTAQGEDAALVLLAFLQYGLKHHVGPRPTPTLMPTTRPLPRSTPRPQAPRRPRRPALGARG